MKGARSPAGRPATSSTSMFPFARAMAMKPSTCSLASATGMNRVEPGAFAIHRFGSSMCGAAGVGRAVVSDS
jgi:hypothetical protein